MNIRFLEPARSELDDAFDWYSLGLRVIRFSNNDVLRNIEGVYEELSKTITAINSGG